MKKGQDVRNRVPALKVFVYISDGESHRGVPLSSAILNFLFYRGISNAVATKGAAGFGAEHKLRSSSFVEVSDHLPVVIQFFDAKDKVEPLLDKLQEIVGDGAIEIQETTVLENMAAAARPERVAPPLEGPVSVMTIYIGESDRWNGIPLHEALVDAFRSNDISGVTVARGVLGYGAKKEIHKERVFRLSSDLPIAVTVVDQPEKIRQLSPLLDQMVEQGLVVVSEATLVAYSHRKTAV